MRTAAPRTTFQAPEKLILACQPQPALIYTSCDALQPRPRATASLSPSTAVVSAAMPPSLWVRVLDQVLRQPHTVEISLTFTSLVFIADECDRHLADRRLHPLHPLHRGGLFRGRSCAMLHHRQGREAFCAPGAAGADNNGASQEDVWVSGLLSDQLSYDV